MSIVTVLLTIPSLLFSQPPAISCTPPGTACIHTPYNGTINLDMPSGLNLHTISDTPITISYAKDPLPTNFSDVKYKDDEKYKAPCSKPANNECSNDGSSLVYDVYYPTDIDTFSYKNCPLPVVILFHAGGFIECSNFRQPGIVIVCQELAKRGFIAISVQYRTGRIIDTFNANLTTVQQELAIYRACQDARGAIRSIIKRQQKEGIDPNIHDPYRIDENRIFVGGFSAGGVIAMSASWYKPAMVYAVFPNGTGSPTIQQALGDIDANFYYASKTEVPNFQSRIVGNACMWGAIGIPYLNDLDEYAFFDSSLLKPLISFQGKKDNVFPYLDGTRQYVNFYSTSSSIYNSEGLCVNPAYSPYYLDHDGTSVDLINGSTLNMRNILIHYNILNEHYVDCDMFHGFTTDLSGFHGNFGTSANTEAAASVYLAKRIATFFQAVLTVVNLAPGTLGTDYFPDCPNTRIKCTSQTTTCINCTN